MSGSDEPAGAAAAEVPDQAEAAAATGRSTELGVLLALRTWVDWLVVAYELHDEWPECWYRHTAAINELLALQRWHAAALAEEPAGSQLALWHDGLARVRERAIRPLLQSCHATGHLDPSADETEGWLASRERWGTHAREYWSERFSTDPDAHRNRSRSHG